MTPDAASPLSASQSTIPTKFSTTGVDLSDVRSALDRLMLGVEKGWEDPDTSIVSNGDGDKDWAAGILASTTDVPRGHKTSSSTETEESEGPTTPPNPLSLSLSSATSDTVDSAEILSALPTKTPISYQRPSTIAAPTALESSLPVLPEPSLAPPSAPPTRKLSGKEIIQAHEANILAKRREARLRERGGDFRRLGHGRPGKRRSLSTGDAEDLRNEPTSSRMAELNLLGLPLEPLESDVPFRASVDVEMQRLYPEARKYRLREHEDTIYASADDKISHMGRVGDLDSGRAWRTVRRPSDMNEYSRQIKELRAQERPGKSNGKVFVRVIGVKGLSPPLPSQPTFFTCTLNNGIHFVTTPDCRLVQDSRIDQEFELIEHSNLEFTLTLKVRKDPHILAQMKSLTSPPPPIPTPAPPKGLRAFFSTPKKAKNTPPKQPPCPPVIEETLARYLRSDGTLGRASIGFKDIASKCDTRLFETTIPVMGQWNEDGRQPRSSASPLATRCVGHLVLQMFRVPPLPGIAPDALPQSLGECQSGLRHIVWHKTTHFEGILTQNGGDCSTWRRRQLKIIGSNLVAFNDITKKPAASIDLRKVAAVVDTNQLENPGSGSGQQSSRPRDSLDGAVYVERSLRLTFTDGEEISFFADDDEQKAKWLYVLREVIRRIPPPHPLWAEAIWLRQQSAANSAQTQQHRRAPSGK
jgi:hypothetical protein